MPRYNFKCKDCKKEEDFVMSIAKSRKFKPQCSSCNSEMTQVIASFNSSVSQSPEEKQRRIKEEAAAIADKIRSGDQNLISEIYGDK